MCLPVQLLTRGRAEPKSLQQEASHLGTTSSFARTSHACLATYSSQRPLPASHTFTGPPITHAWPILQTLPQA